jgi:general secretion pathway protein A
MAAASIADLRKDAHSAPGGRWPQALAAVVVLGALSAAALMAFPGRDPSQEVQALIRPAPALSRGLALQGLAAVPEQENLIAAVNAVLSAWRSPPLLPAPGQTMSLRTLARQRGLMATKIDGNLDILARLDAPALLHVTVPGAGNRLVALVGLGPDGVSVVPAIAGRSTLTRAELALIWTGGATLLWKDFHGIASPVQQAEMPEGVRLLQGLLKGAGCYQGPLDGILAAKTVQAIDEFQRRERLGVDGKATGLTLLLLYRRAGGFFPPALTREGTGGKGAGKRAGCRYKVGHVG